MRDKRILTLAILNSELLTKRKGSIIKSLKRRLGGKIYNRFFHRII